MSERKKETGAKRPLFPAENDDTPPDEKEEGCDEEPAEVVLVLLSCRLRLRQITGRRLRRLGADPGCALSADQERR